MVDTTTSLPADRRFRDSFGLYVSAGLCLSVWVHLVVILAFPALAVEDGGAAASEPVALVSPPDIRIPDPPDPVPRPAEPVISDVAPPDEATIEAWDRERQRVGAPPPPPRVRVETSSGYEAVDTAAEKVGRAMEFEPALNRDRPVGVWVRQAVRFRVR